MESGTRPGDGGAVGGPAVRSSGFVVPGTVGAIRSELPVAALRLADGALD